MIDKTAKIQYTILFEDEKPLVNRTFNLSIQERVMIDKTIDWKDVGELVLTGVLSIGVYFGIFVLPILYFLS